YPFHQATGHVGNLSVFNPLDGEFPYINENLEDFTDVENEEEDRERVEEEIRAQIEEIEILQAEVEERETKKFVTFT
ncbi:hypothetical protein KI387_000969, partial [Taxus chinensis]